MPRLWGRGPNRSTRRLFRSLCKSSADRLPAERLFKSSTIRLPADLLVRLQMESNGKPLRELGKAERPERQEAGMKMSQGEGLEFKGLSLLFLTDSLLPFTYSHKGLILFLYQYHERST